MKLKLLIFISFISINNLFADSNFLKKDVINSLIRINSFYMDKYSDYTRLEENEIRTSTNTWQRGIYYDGILSLYNIINDDELIQFAEDWSIYNNWKISNNKKSIKQIYSCANVYIQLNEFDKDLEKTNDIYNYIDTLNHSHFKNNISNIPYFYFSTLTYLRISDINNSSKLKEWIYDSYFSLKKSKYYDKKMKLWYNTSVNKKRISRKNKEFNIFTNALIISSLSELINKLPDNKENENINNEFKTHISSIIKFFKIEDINDNLLADDIISYSLICYSLSKGINSGVLDKKVYEPYINNFCNTLCKSYLSSDGSIKNIFRNSFEKIDSSKSKYNYEDAGIGIILKSMSEMVKVLN